MSFTKNSSSVFAIVLFIFSFYLSKEILVFNEEVILLCAGSIMFIVFMSVGWNALESILAIRANEIFFIFEDLYNLKLEKLEKLKSVYIKKSAFNVRLKALYRVLHLNIVYVHFLNKLLEDFFFLYSYSYFILNEMVNKELSFINYFANNKIIENNSELDFINLFIVQNNVPLKSTYNMFINNKLLLCETANDLSVNALISSFINSSTESLLKINLNKYFLIKNTYLASTLYFLMFSNFWKNASIKNIYYYNVYKTYYNLLSISRVYSLFTAVDSNILAPINFNSFLQLLLNSDEKLGLKKNLANCLTTFFYKEKFLQLNFISPTFFSLYYRLYFKTLRA